MFETKYLIIIGVILCLLVIYYFYDEISNIKRTFLPTYQKTMALEAKLMEYERRYKKPPLLKSNKDIQDAPAMVLGSPIMSISYNSQDAKHNPDSTSSIMYATDPEAKELLEVLSKKNKPSLDKTAIVLAQPAPPKSTPSKSIPPKSVPHLDSEIRDMDPTISDTIHVSATTLGLPSDQNTDLDGIWNAINNLANDANNTFSLDMELDLEVVKSISDSVHKAELPIEETFSDIPVSKLNQYKAKVNNNQIKPEPSLVKTKTKTKPTPKPNSNFVKI